MRVTLGESRSANKKAQIISCRSLRTFRGSSGLRERWNPETPQLNYCQNNTDHSAFVVWFSGRYMIYKLLDTINKSFSALITRDSCPPGGHYGNIDFTKTYINIYKDCWFPVDIMIYRPTCDITVVCRTFSTRRVPSHIGWHGHKYYLLDTARQKSTPPLGLVCHRFLVIHIVKNKF